MKIAHNISALNTWRQLTANDNATSKSLQKLSSGLRINSASDDAAGLAISEKMRSQIRGLDMSSKNAQDGQSLVQTAEGALNETHSILQRMRELAVQSANDTNTDTDRSEMQKEIEQLKSEINRISTDTEFNTKKLLDGSIANNANIDTGATLTLQPVFVADSNLAADTYTVTLNTAGIVAADVKSNTTGIDVSTDFDLTTAGISGLDLGDYKLEVSKATGTTFDFTLKDANGVTVASAKGVDITATDATLSNATDPSIKFTINQNAPVQEGEMLFNLNATFADADSITIQNATAFSYNSEAGLKLTGSNFEAGGLKFKIGVDTVLDANGSTADIITTNNALTMHVGANADQTVQVAINKVDTTTLGISGIDVTSQDGAEAALTALDSAIQSVSAERSKLGAISNRLDHTVNNLGTSSENLTAAESRIRDVDMAKEMTEYTKNNVLMQAAQAMLAQANSKPQAVLQLLQ